MKAHATDQAAPVTFKPRAQRSARGALIKKLYALGELPAHAVSRTMIETSKDFETFPDFSYAMTSSKLWRPLTSIYGKCDGTVSGQYHRARVFCFETESLYLWCVSETGDQGTGWLFLEKDKLDIKKLKPTNNYLPPTLQIQPNLGAEIARFALNLLSDMAQASATSRADLVKLGAGSWTPLLALQAQEEAIDLSQGVRHVPRSAVKSRM